MHWQIIYTDTDQVLQLALAQCAPKASPVQPARRRILRVYDNLPQMPHEHLSEKPIRTS